MKIKFSKESIKPFAERVSPKISGILSGYPLGTALALFFYGYEVNAEFASQSAIYTLLGLVASQTFVYIYYQTSLKFSKYSPLISSITSICAFLIVAFILGKLNFSKYMIVAVTLISVVFYIFLFRKLPDIKIKTKAKLNFNVILIRAIIATAIIILVTSLPEIIGKKWAGFFSGFPITLYPLILIIHITYQKEHVHTILKNFPKGVGSLILYSISIYKCYPLFGIYIGTIISFIIATIYLIIILNLNKIIYYCRQCLEKY